jgi:hypothetical protein
MDQEDGIRCGLPTTNISDGSFGLAAAQLENHPQNIADIFWIYLTYHDTKGIKYYNIYLYGDI